MPTIKEVADLAGVSVGTVSHVITGSVPVSAPLRRKVQAAIRELDYHPNHVARNLKTRRTRADPSKQPSGRPKRRTEPAKELAGTTGFEPATSDVTGRRSNQLNYVPARTSLCFYSVVGSAGLEPATSCL